MAKIVRRTLIQFGTTINAASEIGQFGSYASPDFSGDVGVMQSGTSWERGWFGAVLNTNRQFIQDQNAIDYVFCYMLSYLLQQGIAEWDAGTTYYLNSICQIAGQIFISLQDDNTNNNPGTSPTFWQAGLPGAEVSGAVKAYAGVVAPSGYLLCQGQAVSRSTYAALFNICGTAYGAGDGSTTFNIPDLRGRVPVGFLTADPNFGVVGGVGGQETIDLQHNHVMQADGGATGPVDTANFQNRVKIAGGNLYGITGAQQAEGVSTTVSDAGNPAQSIIQPYQTMNYIIKT